MIARLLRALFGWQNLTTMQETVSMQELPTNEDRSIYRAMDALPTQLPFKLDDLKIVEMKMRHMAFEMTAIDAAMGLLGLEPPLNYEDCQGKIEATLRRIRAGEELPCDDVVPTTALGVLWGWSIVSDCGWEWRAVQQNGWETLAVCDVQNRYLILPIQYIREIAEGDAAQTLSPNSQFEAIRDGKLPSSQPNALKRIC